MQKGEHFCDTSVSLTATHHGINSFQNTKSQLRSKSRFLRAKSDIWAHKNDP